MTICEMLMRGILNTYNVSDAEGTLETCEGSLQAHHKISLEKQNQIFDDMLRGASVIKLLLQAYVASCDDANKINLRN